jgi:hypothetical protein
MNRKSLAYALPVIFTLASPSYAMRGVFHGGGGHMGASRGGSAFRAGGFDQGFRGNRGRFFSNGYWYPCTPYYYQLGYCAFNY